MQPYIKQDCLLDWDTIKSTITEKIAQFPQAQGGAENEVKMQERKRGVGREWGSENSFPHLQNRSENPKAHEVHLLVQLFSTLASERPALWFNDDCNCSEALEDAVSFRRRSIARLVMSVIRNKRHATDGMRRGRIQLEPSGTSGLCLDITWQPSDKTHTLFVR